MPSTLNVIDCGKLNAMTCLLDMGRSITIHATSNKMNRTRRIAVAKWRRSDALIPQEIPLPMSLISESALQEGDELARRFREAQPFRHVVVDDFFDPAFCQSILDQFPRFEDRFALNEMGDVGGKAVRMGVRELSPAYLELDAFLQTPEFLGYVSKVTGIPDLLYDADYV